MGLAFLLDSASASADWTPFVLAESFTYSGPVTIREYLKLWHGPLKRDPNALTFNWLESGLRDDSFSTSLVIRYDYEIKANHDSALLYYQAKNHLELIPGTSYALNVRAYHQRSWGVRLAYDLKPVPRLDLTGGVTLLKAAGLEDGSIRGSALVVGAKDYNYDAQLNEFYSHDYIFERVLADSPRGYGLTFDLAFRWELAPGWTIFGRGRDLYGFIDWNSAPYTSATVTSDVKHYDSNGYVEFSPTLSGIESNKSYWQTLKPRGTVGGEWAATDRQIFSSSLFVTDAETFWSIAARCRFFREFWLGVEAMPLLGAGGISVAWRQLGVSLVSDGLRLERAHVLSLHINLAWSFQ